MEKLIIANWKEHKTVREALDFLEKFESIIKSIPLAEKQIVICPPFCALSEVSKFVITHHLPVFVGAQDVSAYDGGAYTGEVSATQIRELAEFVIIGHSERRKYFNETAKVIQKKVSNALSANLTPIVCVRGEKDEISENVCYVAFEPVEAIGTGNPEEPKKVEKMFTILTGDNTERKMIYGGSIDQDNIKVYTKIPRTAGFLIGGASLEAESFANIISAC